MLTLRLFLLIIVTLLCREMTWTASSADAFVPTWLALSVCLGFGVLAKMYCWRLLRSRPESTFDAQQIAAMCDAWAQRWAVRRHWLEWLWVVALPLTLLGSQWGPWLAVLEQQAMPQSMLLVLWFMPSFFALLSLEFTSAQFDVFVESRYQQHRARTSSATLSNLSHASRQDDSMTDRYANALATRLRLGSLANVVVCLLPVLLIAGTADLLKMAGSDLPSGVQSLIACGVGLLAVGLFLPHLMSRWMGVQQLSASNLRRRVEAYSHSLGIQVKPMWVSSQGRWSGAAIVGWIPGRRQLWLGDGLIDQLTEEEVDMVIMHELAHVTRQHFWWRLLPVIAACGMGLATVSLASLALGTTMNNRADIVAQLAGCVISGWVLVSGLSYLSRSCELDADRQACRLGASNCSWTGGEPERAAATLAMALSKLHGPEPRQQATWLHPALPQRLANLQGSFPSPPSPQTVV